MTEQLFNQGVLALAVACGSSDVSLTLSGAGVGGLPTTGTYNLIWPDTFEIMTVTSRSGSVVQVTRGAEGTTATGHAQNVVPTTGVTARSLTQLAADIAAGRGGTAGLCSYGGTPSYSALLTDCIIILDSSGWIAQSALQVTLPAAPTVTQRVAFNEDGWILGRPPPLVNANGNPIQPYSQNVQASKARGELGSGSITAIKDLGAMAAWMWTGTFWALVP